MKKLPILLLYFGVIPFVLSIVTFALLSMGLDNLLFASLITLIPGGLITGYVVSKKLQQKDLLTGMLVPFLFPLVYTAVLWGVFMVISGGFYGGEAWTYYFFSHLPWAPFFLFDAFIGEGRLFLYGPLAYELSFVFGMLVYLIIKKLRPAFNKKQLLTVLTVIILGMGTGAFVQWERSKTVLPSYGFEYGGGYSSTDLTPYEVTNSNNILPRLEETPAFTIKNAGEMPVLDGAEAAFPVYSAFANAVYEDVSDVMFGGREVVSFTNTIYAYERLISGEVDIYFGAEPSKEQREMAERSGKELVMTPIGKEAFVFFVNENNKIDSLKVTEIKDIYSGKIKNWSELGGKNQKIIAFQRPKNSGSQTLLEKIMGDTPIMKPLKEDVPEGMGGIIEQVADYRNYNNSLGFSFRFFATGMNANNDIKLLAIDGIEPTPENISSGKYPFTASLYAITLNSNDLPTLDPFLEWMTGPQGQEIVEKIGYIPN